MEPPKAAPPRRVKGGAHGHGTGAHGAGGGGEDDAAPSAASRASKGPALGLKLDVAGVKAHAEAAKKPTANELKHLSA